MMADYVVVVLGIFFVIASIFWILCRKSFLGPVRATHPGRCVVCNMTNLYGQRFDMIASHDRDTDSPGLERGISGKGMVETFEN